MTEVTEERPYVVARFECKRSIDLSVEVDLRRGPAGVLERKDLREENK